MSYYEFDGYFKNYGTRNHIPMIGRSTELFLNTAAVCEDLATKNSPHPVPKHLPMKTGYPRFVQRAANRVLCDLDKGIEDLRRISQVIADLDSTIAAMGEPEYIKEMATRDFILKVCIPDWGLVPFETNDEYVQRIMEAQKCESALKVSKSEMKKDADSGESAEEAGVRRKDSCVREELCLPPIEASSYPNHVVNPNSEDSNSSDPISVDNNLFLEDLDEGETAVPGNCRKNASIPDVPIMEKDSDQLPSKSNMMATELAKEESTSHSLGESETRLEFSTLEDKVIEEYGVQIDDGSSSSDYSEYEVVKMPRGSRNGESTSETESSISDFSDYEVLKIPDLGSDEGD